MAKMSREERLDILRRIIEQRRALTKSELQDAVNVSRMTLFRDLETLKEEGFIDDLYGSVTIRKPEYDLLQSMESRIDEKRLIAQEAIKMVVEDDVIFVGAGTTTLEIARLLSKLDLHTTVITNSLPIAMELEKNDNVSFIMLGGYYHRKTRSLFGPAARKSLEGLNGRIVFFGANGVDIESGITGYFAEQTDLIREMMKSCKIKVAVVDSTKFGKLCANRICHLNQVDTIITDNGLAESFQEQMKSHAVSYLLA